MIASLPFFRLAMVSHSRQLAFRQAIILHALVVFGLLSLFFFSPSIAILQVIGHCLLALGIVEGAMLIGWRLSQLPKSQALEFLLVSPVQPKFVFLSEGLVGVARFLLIQLASLPLFVWFIQAGLIAWQDLAYLLAVPMVWGAFFGISIVTWAYELRSVRRVGELIALIGVIIYLVVGVLAAERLRFWLQELPGDWPTYIQNSLLWLQQFNPFAVMQNGLNPKSPNVHDWNPWLYAQGFALVACICFWLRSSIRLRGHFQDLHYFQLANHRADQTHLIGETPLTWWAIKRVMNYAGQVNMWLAGGFSLIYGAYIVAGEHWPFWLGTLVFQIIDRLGGAPALITGLILLAAVPAAFQYGLWDASVPDRCKRLELLLLTNLKGMDYWHAAYRAAWKRGRGYLFIAGYLAAALVISGKISSLQILAAIAASIILLGFIFAVGFWCFRSGSASNGIGSVLILGMPMLLFFCLQSPNLVTLASFLPPGAIYTALIGEPNLLWMLGPCFIAGTTILLTRSSIRTCEASLRTWYDQHAGLKWSG